MADSLRWFVMLTDGPTRRHCWVNKHVKVGDKLTLKDSEEPDRMWLVEYVSAQGRFAADIDQSWHVGGM
jgi:hypothetical protein